MNALEDLDEDFNQFVNPVVRAGVAVEVYRILGLVEQDHQLNARQHIHLRRALIDAMAKVVYLVEGPLDFPKGK